jgi:hypothetical protein
VTDPQNYAIHANGPAPCARLIDRVSTRALNDRIVTHRCRYWGIGTVRRIPANSAPPVAPRLIRSGRAKCRFRVAGRVFGTHRLVAYLAITKVDVQHSPGLETEPT